MNVSLDNLQAPVLDPLMSNHGSVSESQSLLRRQETSRDTLTFTEKKSRALLGMLYLLQAVPLGFACLTTPRATQAETVLQCNRLFLRD
jgi:hypothetical protein